MITLKTKAKVIVNPKTKLEDYAYLHISDVNINDKKYFAQTKYFYKRKIVEGDDEYYVEELIEKVKPEQSTFTIEQSTQLQQLLGATGSNHYELTKDLITKVALYTLTQTRDFGLTGADFEVYTEPNE